MKKIISLVLVLIMCVAAFTACGGDENPADSNGDASESAVQDSTYDVGQFTVTVPGGWMAIPVMDTFGADPNAKKTDTIRVCKDAKSEFDILSKPYAEIILWDDTQGVMPLKSIYDNVVDLEAFTTGDHTWTGFSAETSLGQKLTILWEDTGDLQYQVNVWTDTTGGKISLEDEDVKKLLGSIKVNKSADAATESAE